VASGPAAPCMPSQGSEARKRTLLTFFEGERTILILRHHDFEVCQARIVHLALSRFHVQRRQGGQLKQPRHRIKHTKVSPDPFFVINHMLSSARDRR
jgi:hypothetical protein